MQLRVDCSSRNGSSVGLQNAPPGAIGEQNGEGAAVTTMGEVRRGRSDGTDLSHGPTSGGP